MNDFMKEFEPNNNLTNQQRVGITQTQDVFYQAVEQLMTLVPNGAHKTAAFRKMLEAKMTCVQAITHTKENT